MRSNSSFVSCKNDDDDGVRRGTTSAEDINDGFDLFFSISC